MNATGWMEYVLVFSTQRGNLKLLAIATPHQSRQNIGSEMPIFHRDSFPPGEAKGRLRELIPFNVPICSGNGGDPRRLRRSGRQVGDPYKAYAFIQVLPEIRGCGRLRASPTGRERSSGYLRKSGGSGGFSAPTEGVCHAAGRFGNGDVFTG